MANLLSTTVNGALNVQGSSMYVTASQLHIGKASSGTAQMSFESWGSYTGAIAMNSSGAFHWGGQGNSEWYFKKNNTYNGDYSASGTTVLRIASDGNIYSAYYGDWLSNIFNSKQNASTAITTSNIGSQSVNYATSAGNADTVDGRHADYFYPGFTDNGYSTGDIAGSGTHQRLWGTDSVQNLLAFRPPTSIEYSIDGIDWRTTTATTGLWDNKMFGKWGGFNMSVGNNVGGWRYVRMTWVNFGYHFFSHFTLAHSTNGHNFNFVFQKSDPSGNNFTEAFRQNGISSWPGYTFTKHSNVSGWWDTRDIRFVFELNHNNDFPNNSISVGHIGLMGGYSGFTRLYDWDADRNMFFGGVIYAATGNSNNWNTAFGWGNHATAGYQAASTAITTSNIGSQSVSYATTAGSLTSMNISQFSNNSGYLTGYSETDTLASVTGRGATTASQVSFTKTDDHAISVGTIRGRAVNSQGGEFIQLYERVNIGGPSGWGAANTAAPTYGLSVYGGATIGYGNSGGLAVTGTSSATGDMRAPIFYDSNDTAFYVDPNSSSRLRNLYVGDGGSNWVDTGGWGTQLHVSNGPHSIIRVYARDEAIQTVLYSHNGGQSKVGSGTNHDFTIVRNFSDRMTFYTGYTYANGYLQAADSLRAPIFYDSNDTGYYLDPNGTSNLLQLNTATRARWNMPRIWYDRSSRNSDQGYWTGTNGWGTSDGTWANAWSGGFSGWDIWGTGTDHPQGAGYVHAQGIVSGQHYASSSVGYGWMMVGAADAVANRYWLRGKWDTTTSDWVEMITTGNIGSQSVASAGDSTNLGGRSSSRYLYYRGYSTSGDFQTLQSTESIIRFDQVGEINSWSNAPAGVYTYGGVLSLRGDNFGLQIYGSHTGDLVFKTQWNNDQYSGWRNIIHSGNIGSQSVASAGNATTAGGLSVHTGRNNEANKIVRTQENGYVFFGYINSTSGNENNNSNADRVWGTNGSDDYLRTYRTSALSVGYAASAGNSSTTSQIVFSDLKINFPSGVGGGHSFGANHYSMGLDVGNGVWSHPHYRDVIIGYHTGIRLGASYSGIRFYNNSPTTDANNDGNGDGGEALLMTIGGYVGTANGTDVVVNNNLFANVSMRAPIFYDSSDTTYYLDPAGNGTRAAFLNGNVWISPKSESYGEGIAFLMPSQATWGGLRWVRGVNNFTGAWAFGYFGNESNDNIGFHSGGVNGWRLDHSWNMTTIGSVRAPIFYDSDDTGYSWNPNTSSAHRFSTPNGYVDIGPMNGSWCHFQTDRPRFYFGNSVTVDGDLKRYSDGALYIHSSNYNSYAPTLTGGGASGSWGISVTGSAGGVSWANVSSKPSRWLNTTNLIDDNAPDTITESGFWQSYLGSGNPTGTWFNYVNVRHSNPANAHGFQLGMSYYDNNLWFRSYSGNVTYLSWSRALGTNTDPYPSNMNQYVRTTDDVTHNSTTSTLFLVNGHSDNTKGYRIHNTSGSSVSAMFTNSSNQLVIAAGAVDQINLNKKVYVNGVALGVNVAPSATAGRIDASNDIVAFSSSDERLKYNITPIENAIDKVKSLTGVEFDWKPEYKHAHGYEGHDTGIIAQQVQEVIPSAVRTNDTGFLAVRYEKLIGLLVEGMKDQQTQIDELKAKLDGLTK